MPSNFKKIIALNYPMDLRPELARTSPPAGPEEAKATSCQCAAICQHDRDRGVGEGGPRGDVGEEEDSEVASPRYHAGDGYFRLSTSQRAIPLPSV